MSTLTLLFPSFLRPAGGSRGAALSVLLATYAAAAITISAPIPIGTIGQPYTASLIAAGGNGPYGYALVSGSLPTGLSLSSGGTISGTPSSAGQFVLGIQSTDSTNATGLSNVALRVNSTSGLQIATTTLSAGRIGNLYDFTLVAQGGTTPYSWDLLLGGGALPSGMSLSSSGRILGTPSSGGVFPVVVRVTDINGSSFQAALTLRVDAAVLLISSTSLAAAPANVPYNQTINAIGGNAPYLFNLLSGSLPPGLSLSSAGVISGTPSNAGTYNFFIRATDASAAVAQASFSIIVSPSGPRLLPPTLANGIVNQAYSGALLAQGGTAPYSFAIISGSLPTGLALSSTGAISGTPNISGVFPITVRLTDAAGQSTQADLLFNVNSSLFTITNVTPSNAFANSPYSLNLSTTGANGLVAFTLLSGSLPSGLALTSTGMVTGTPLAVGTTSFVIRAIDATGATAQLPLNIRVQSSTLAISSVGLANGQVGQPYSSTLTASNGTPPYSFALSGGFLPLGLTLSLNGNVSGSPTAGGLFQAIFRVTDVNGAASQRILPIFIAANGLSLTSLTLASARRDQSYSSILQATGGTPPYTFELEGLLPPGLALSPSGLLFGSPTQATGGLFTVRVTDAAGVSSFVTYNFNINTSTLNVGSPFPGPGQLARAYSYTFLSTGANGTTTYTVDSGALPPGLELNPNGTLSGIPTALGTYFFNLKATDAVSSALFGEVISIGTSQLGFASLQLPDVTVGNQYFFALTGVGGTAPYVFSLASGTLPPGLALATSGTITGLATTSGSYPITLRVTDASGASATTTAVFLVNTGGTFSIATSAVPTARPGEPYSSIIVATGGTAPYTFSLVGGSSLPAGLSLSAGGILSGVSLTDGSATFVVRAQDATGASTQRTLTLGISSLNLSLANIALPGGIVGNGYSAILNPTGGLAPYTVSIVSGALPPGITLSSGGILSGTPTTAGTYPLVIRLTDANGNQFQRALSISIGTNFLSFSGAILPNVFVGQRYRADLVASNGVAPYVFSIANGSLPGGLTLSPNGVISGIPTTAGQSTVIFRVIDAIGVTALSTITFGANQSTLNFGFTILPISTVGQAFNFASTASGGASPYTYTVLSGLPPGLTMSAAGVFRGAPTQEGTYNVLLRVQDSAGLSVESTYVLTVAPAGFRVSNQSLQAAALNQSYNQALTTSGGSGTVTFSVVMGSLPTGLSLSSAGVISGIPNVIGSFPLSIRAVDGNNAVVTANFTLVVFNPVVTFATNSLPSGTIGQSFNQNVTLSGGTGPYTVILNSGSLPPGLTLSTAGALTGTPTTAGTYTFNLRATDSVGQSVNGDFLIGIGGIGAPSLLSVVSSANYAGSGVAPGEIVVLFGTNLGPANLLSFSLVNSGVGTTLGGTRVLFDGIPAPLIYTSANQVAVVTPFGLAGRTVVRVSVEMNGVPSATIQIPVRTAKPAIFTLDSSGNGPGALLNQNATVNSPQNPADRLSIITLYVTGVGQTAPASQDGQVVNTTSSLVNPVTVTVNGQPAEVVYAGNAPGLVPGVAQVNVRLPSGVVSGLNTVTVSSGAITSGGNVTIFVR